MTAVYHIHDEPTGSRSHALIVNPFWPLLTMMLAGAWMGMVMFGLNAVLLRGPTWRRELLLAALVLLGAAMLYILILAAVGQRWLPELLLKYALLGIFVWKFTLGYWLFFLQQNTFALYEYFGGNAREAQRGSTGMVLLVVGMLFRSSVLSVLDSAPLYWRGLWFWVLR